MPVHLDVPIGLEKLETLGLEDMPVTTLGLDLPLCAEEARELVELLLTRPTDMLERHVAFRYGSSRSPLERGKPAPKEKLAGRANACAESRGVVHYVSSAVRQQWSGYVMLRQGGMASDELIYLGEPAACPRRAERQAR